MDESEKRRAYRLIEQLKTAGTPPREDNVQKTKTTTRPQPEPSPAATPKSKTEALEKEVLFLRHHLKDVEEGNHQLQAQLAEAREKAEVAQGRLDQLTARTRERSNTHVVNESVLRLLMEGVRPVDRGSGGFTWQELGHGRMGGPYYYIAGKWLAEDEGCRIIDSFFHHGAPSVSAPG